MAEPRPRALLAAVAVGAPVDTREIGELAAAAGLDGLALQVVRVRAPRAATYIGAGAADKLAHLVDTLSAQVVVFNCALGISQQRNLSRLLGGARVIDRNELILDIFARRAKTFEGKLQVEMAKCEHQMSKLTGLWTHLERQTGGIGVRGGPGEKQLEMDRRLLAEKIVRLRRQTEKMALRNQQARRRRRLPTAVLVGYTNVGKSSLFNRLTRAAMPAKNRLFDTLDSTARRAHLCARSHMVVSDTVGFIRGLPHALVAGFRATLREAAHCDRLLLVADASREDCQRQVAVVQEVLQDIGAGHIRKILVMNKIDKIRQPARVEQDAGCGNMTRVWLSSKTGDGVEILRETLLREFTWTV